ncbi:MAG: PIG-L family deacetylase [Nanoarchaeota archaeon]|nr:PIG-L family deacetylase [Nanoarchaeota archaeon]MBU1269503.1 PIG-L family deacetylase [Nanoarchaeota archaeon]MBU1603894.1 PIG-L family deacetylase [Nanoarchaeota archaeon]
MIYKTLTKGANLFVGAHPDDNFLGAFKIIKSNSLDSIVMTVTNGATIFPSDYPVPELKEVDTPEKYAAIRKEEEIKVMQKLGVKSKNMFFMNLADQQSHEYINEIIDKIKELITTYKPTRIFTHEFPQGHPDHEIASFCVSQAIKETNSQEINIFEYPTYVIVPGQTRVNSKLLTTKKNDTIIYYKFTEEEFKLRNELMKMYANQPDLEERYTTRGEEFRVLYEPRKFSGKFPRSDYIKPWVREVTPEQIHEKIKETVAKRR